MTKTKSKFSEILGESLVHIKRKKNNTNCTHIIYYPFTLLGLITLPEYRKKEKNILLLDWCYNAKPTSPIRDNCFSQTDQSMI